jgi:hypothetical protein
MSSSYAISTKIKVWDVTPCRSVCRYQHVTGNLVPPSYTFCHEGGESRYFSNVCTPLPNYSVTSQTTVLCALKHNSAPYEWLERIFPLTCGFVNSFHSNQLAPKMGSHSLSTVPLISWQSVAADSQKMRQSECILRSYWQHSAHTTST